ncbi:cobalamin biosynthesis protein [Roseicyclus marinus]|uniref:cobalamin biosynthesis protein n=1 Tax=Roseicyclus marinus TaxID=2161673 RepID=UPI00240FDE92|nr:cobalamin biosynthesis protein [Roseicyclus marinus]MDG3039763.1 cobalamin biosynthesis protein [Roseicyclus marinus]
MIVAGFGFRGAADVASLRDALDRTGHTRQVGLIATAKDKAETPTFQRLAVDLGLPARGVDSADLAAQLTQTVSAASLAARGTGSMAEAAALAAAGPGARLIVARQISADGMATCALAERNER